MMIPQGFKGAARPMTDSDIAEAAQMIGVDTATIRAVLEVEAAGSGFDRQGRPKMLFEPHVFWRFLPATQRSGAQANGLAYPKWKPGAYPSDSYPRLFSAMQINEDAALRSASFSAAQIMGFNHAAAGYKTPQDMVADFCDSEAAGLFAMIRFIENQNLTKHLRSRDWASFARGYNGSEYAKNGYHTKLAAAYDKHSAQDVSTPTSTRLAFGSRSPRNAQIQGALKALGLYKLPIDNIWGNGQQKALDALAESNARIAALINGETT